ncbi:MULTISPECIES: hypothetical protein [unclassified Azospirillum]|uniref:hypothetical protein n=1 Tax=unclassified Azospirillum TaxID=2630922 RepID=UPI000B765485|nr:MULTISPECIES: hypothetical protein [unclassified Azospirillum]SNS62252.1 ferrochelatase [Azospirillum sp. RU38E]SNS81466.1 ferrochelatase [Azospirillum sp. RU37A]
MSLYPSPRWRIAVVLLRHAMPAQRADVFAYLQRLLTAFQPEMPPWRRRLKARLAALRWTDSDLFPAEPDQGPWLTTLEEKLWDQGDVRLFQAPLHDDAAMGRVVDEVAAWRADETLLLPADPFYTPPRNGHAMDAWRRLTAAAGFRKANRGLCCHPTDPLMLRALVRRIAPVLETASLQGRAQLLMVLPWGLETAEGDPALWQADRLARELSPLLGLQPGRVTLCQLALPGLPLSSTSLPGLRGALEHLSGLDTPVLVLPFTPLPAGLQGWAEKAGVRHLHLVGPGDPALEMAWQTHLVRQARAGHEGICAGFGARQCPGEHSLCPYRSPAVFAPPAAGLQLAAMRERA